MSTVAGERLRRATADAVRSSSWPATTARAPRPTPRPIPLAMVCRAGMETEAQAAMLRRSSAPRTSASEPVEELEILQRAVELDPTTGKPTTIWQCAGACGAGRRPWPPGGRRRSWTTASPSCSAIWAWARALEENPQQAAVHYLKAIQRNPDDYRYYMTVPPLRPGAWEEQARAARPLRSPPGDPGQVADCGDDRRATAGHRAVR